LISGVVTETVGMAIDTIRNQLPTLKTELNALRASGADPAEIAKLTGKIKVMEGALNDAKKTTTQVSDASENTAKESKRDWQTVAQSLSVVNGALDEVMNTFGDMMSEGAKTAVSVMQTTLSATMGVVGAIQMTSETATGAIKAAETASVVLAVISAAVQVIMAITNAIMKNFSAQAQYEKSIENYNRELDELEAKWKRIDYENEKKVGVDYWSSMLEALNKYTDKLDVLKDKEKKQKIRLADINQQQKDAYLNRPGYQNYNEAKNYADETISKKEQEVLDDIAETNDQIIEVEKEIYEAQVEIMEQMATTNATSLGETMASAIVESFSKGINGVKEAFDDTIDDLVRSMLEQRLALQLADQFKGAFDCLTKATTETRVDKALKELGFGSTNSVLIDDQEMATFIEMITNAKEGAISLSEEYQKLFAELGLLDDTIDAESKGFQSMSQDTADELNGRFTALQISGANIDATLREQLQTNKEGLSLVNTIQENVELMAQIATSQLQELRMISQNTALLNDTNNMLKSIKDNTSRL
jgi:hypothetical protein